MRSMNKYPRYTIYNTRDAVYPYLYYWPCGIFIIEEMISSQRYLLAIMLLSVCIAAQTSKPVVSKILLNSLLAPGLASRRGYESPYREAGDLACQIPQQVSPIRQKTQQWWGYANILIQNLGLSKYHLSLYCVSPQKYYIFVYATNAGMVRMNIYGQGDYVKLHQLYIMDFNLKLN